jgi:hypothetical protein
LEQLESTSAEDAGKVARILDDLEDIESTRFHQTVTQRLRVIEKLQQKLEDNTLEAVLQEHIGEHPWLLDPSWERTAGTDLMEDWVRIDFTEEEDEAAGRLDLKHIRTAGKHVIIDLKRPDYTPTRSELEEQTEQYRDTISSLLSRSGVRRNRWKSCSSSASSRLMRTTMNRSETRTSHWTWAMLVSSCTRICLSRPARPTRNTSGTGRKPDVSPGS